MTRVHNFSAGPAALPLEVLEQVKNDIPEYHGQGVSVMEVSHRGPLFADVFERAEANLRSILGVSDDYEVLFLQGGAQTQFALIPMNLGQAQPAGYVDTGHWSKLAIAEAQKLGDVHLVASGADDHYRSIPAFDLWDQPKNLSYLHITPNETIHGVEYHEFPVVSDSVPLIGDMSSTILSRPFDVNKFGLIYAGAQKNIGPAGVTLVIIRKDLLARSSDRIPNMLNYKSHAAKGSMYNTPPTFAIYLSGLVFEWIQRQGGLEAMAQRNAAKAQLLYECIDSSSLFHNPVESAARSWMNIPFTLSDPSQETRFLKEAAEQGLVGLKGHKALGGMRASLYNAVEPESVTALVAFMREFEKRL